VKYCFLACRLIVCSVGARDHVGRPADDRLQRPRTAGEVDDLDVQALIAEEALLFGDGEREVVEEVLATDGDG
jgi:hypothetical protein